MVALGCSEVRVVSKFISVILADLAIVGFAISFWTLASVVFPISFWRLLCRTPQDDIEIGIHGVPFRTMRFLTIFLRNRGRL